MLKLTLRNNLVLDFTTASLYAGFMLTLVGWEIMNILCVPLSLLVIFMTLRADISEKKSAQIIMNKG